MNSAVPASPMSGSQRLPPQAARSAPHGPPPGRATRRSTRRRPHPWWRPLMDLDRCEDVENVASFGGRKIMNSMTFKLFKVISHKSVSWKYVFWHCDMSLSLVLDAFLSHRIVMMWHPFVQLRHVVPILRSRCSWKFLASCRVNIQCRCHQRGVADWDDSKQASVDL